MLTKYFLLNGYEVDIISREKAEDFYIHPNCRMFTIQDDIGTNHVKPYIEKRNRITRLLKGPLFNELRRLKRTIRSLLKALKYKKKACALFQNRVIVPSSYDVCITTFGPLSSVLIGLSLKRHYHIKKWICDFRDPIITIESSKFMKAYFWCLQKKCIKQADYVVIVSHGYLKRICKGKHEQKAYMIPNGFNEHDLDGVNVVMEGSNILHLTYVGSLYEGRRKISALLQVISELIKEGLIDIDKIRINYAGHDFCFIKEQADYYNLSSIVIDHGFLTRNESLALQHSSDILILSTWNSNKETGVFPGKFLEYMGMRKPIIALVDGNLPNSEVCSVMREGNLGVCFEEANRSQDFSTLKSYLYNQYQCFITGNGLVFEPDQIVLNRYEYRNIAEKYMELIDEKD